MFTLTVSMKLILQLFLIVILWNHAAARIKSYDAEKWVNIDNINLQIPDNSTILKGEKKNVNDSWYEYVTWLDTFAGDLLVVVDREYKAYNGRFIKSYEPVKTALSRDTLDDWYELRKLLKNALGLNMFFKIQINDKVRVPSGLFNHKKRGVKFPPLGDRSNSYRMYVEVVDLDNNKLLTGSLLATRRIPFS